MKKNRMIGALLGLLSVSASAQAPSQRNVSDDPAKDTAALVVRLSQITVDSLRTDEYKALLREEIEASMQLEPGVRTLYAVSDKKRPHEVTILEIYADEAAYRNHLATPHFQKYKRETLDMVRSLRLLDVDALIPELKIK
ncbi:putative quinol monooxygenase [uncultured Alistipes sp.]|uniref:putative quinol monooxygenase n=1 Tax=uncultured Alistipes sp. TaxID=538949 RepID=UPI0026150C04|nr:putative quinol monooxygenase [uncultured Alistipes sp.]